MNLQEINSRSMLRVGTILHGTYRIDSYLSSGGFGNTYVATNIEFDERVAIKEFFMKGVTQRDDNQTTVSVSNSENTNSFFEQREKFKKEARRLRKLKNEHIVAVHDLFEENGTAYYVMDYVDGENLAERLKRTGRPMTENEVNVILPQILDAMKAVHDAGIWHLDLKPANIMLERGGKVKLIDFGASKQLNAQKGGATTSTAISYTNGYAPREQMEQNYEKFGPWTDIYALGATIYNLLTNKRPPLPSDIDDDMSEDKHLALPMPASASENIKKLVIWLMRTNRLQRPQSINELGKRVNRMGGDAQNKRNYDVVSNNNSLDQTQSTSSEETIIEKKPQPKVMYEQKEYPSSAKTEHDTSEAKGNSSVWNIILTIAAGIAVALFYYFNGGSHNNAAQTRQDGYGEIKVSYSWGNGIYKGNLLGGKPNGQGRIDYNDGHTTFKGEFLNGIAHGHGILDTGGVPTSSTGFVRYDGKYVNGVRTYGTEYYKNQNYYTGCFEEGQPNGKGVLKNKEGKTLFDGTWYYGRRREGYGIETGKNTDGQTWEYEGEYKNGTPTGHGVLTFNEKRKGYGYKYEGGFLNGELHGTGTWYFVGGGSEKCKYNNGKEVK